MALTKIQRQQVHSKFDGMCAYCGHEVLLKHMQVDHVIPQSRYVSLIKNEMVIDQLRHLTESDVDHIDNLYPTCRVCNKWKSNFDLEAFRREVSEQVKRLNDYSSNYRMAKKYNLIKETITPIIFYFERFLNGEQHC
jgi:5-methylcytosine-specific restriction endonuclease McrA